MSLVALRKWGVIVSAVAALHAIPVHADELSDIDGLVNRGNYQQALDKVNAYLSSRPKDPQGRFLKGIVLTELGKPADAIQVFTGLTEDYPQLPEPYNNLAVLYASQGQYDKARVALELAIHTHPSYATAHENLGDIYAKLASRAYDKALQLDKGNAAAQAKLSMIKDLFGGKPQPTVIAQAPAQPTPPRPATTPQPKPVEPAAPPPVAATPPKPATPTATPTPPPVITPPEPAASPPSAPPVASATPVAPSRGDDVNSIVNAIEGWARAWSAKDVDGYLSFYAQQFQPGEGMSRRTWETTRRQRITKPGDIAVEVRSPEVVFDGDSAATVRFVQAYRSNNLNSTNRKTLRMVRNGSQWQIQQERVGG